jgi:tRNA threonylcarbamoyl adenosine modification protein YeaZ
MKILAFEFSSDHRSVALAELGATARILSEAAVSGIRSTPVLTLVDDALRQANESREAIEALVIGLGPGSYTGVRIAIATAQGWQLARGLKLLGISSVDALAEKARQEGWRGPVVLAIDAQRGEFYLANYDITEGNARVIEPLRLVSRGEIVHRLAAGEIIAGPEVTERSPNARPLFPRAADLARLAVGRNDFVDGEKLEPVYLRAVSFVKAPPPRIVP